MEQMSSNKILMELVSSAYAMVVALVFGGLLTVGVGLSLTLSPALGTPSSYWIALLRLDRRIRN